MQIYIQIVVIYQYKVNILEKNQNQLKEDIVILMKIIQLFSLDKGQQMLFIN